MSESGSDPATSLFIEYLQRLEAGEDLDFEGFVAQYPEHEEALRERKRLHDHLCGMLEHVQPRGTISEQIKDKYGDEADPSVSLKGEEEGSTDLSTEVLQRLSSRGEGYGRYRLKGEIDRGGQGAILRVWDEDLRRNLAMKIMLGQVDAPASGETPPVDSKTLGRFLEEAQVTGQLDHPGIVPVHELGLDADGRVYFTMKLVKGESLAEVFEKVKTGEDGWNQTRALGVLLKVCEAMAYAHDKGVIHRDLKPANIMVGRFGEVYVMDWGLARVVGREDGKDIRIQPQLTTESLLSERRDHGDTPDSPLVTMDGDVVGTPAYMSPEQARGDLEQVGPQSDVYSIGAILYELLAGHMPYVKPGTKATNYAVWRWAQEGPPEPLPASGVPVELAAICEKAMAREIERRYPDVGELNRDLSAFLEQRVVRAYETGRWAETRKWVRRNKLLVGGLGAGGSLVLAALVAIVILWARGEIAFDKAAYAMDRDALAARFEPQAVPPPGTYRFTPLVWGVDRCAFAVEYAGPRTRFELVLEIEEDGMRTERVLTSDSFGGMYMTFEGDTSFSHNDKPLLHHRQLFALERFSFEELPSGENTFGTLEYFLPDEPNWAFVPRFAFRVPDGGPSGGQTHGSWGPRLLSDSEPALLWEGHRDRVDENGERRRGSTATLSFRLVP